VDGEDGVSLPPPHDEQRSENAKLEKTMQDEPEKLSIGLEEGMGENLSARKRKASSEIPESNPHLSPRKRKATSEIPESGLPPASRTRRTVSNNEDENTQQSNRGSKQNTKPPSKRSTAKPASKRDIPADAS
jgi:hypothetical protein